jgi:hypothetical protein
MKKISFVRVLLGEWLAARAGGVREGGGAGEGRRR